jgi:uncharacterized protein
MIFVFIASIFILLQFVSLYITYKLLFPKKHSVEFTFQDQLSRGEVTSSFLKIQKTEFQIPSTLGYLLSGFYIKGKNKKTIIFCHGIAWTRMGMIKYMDLFLKEGWNIIAYDHRGCGNSGGGTPSFGFFEKQDLSQIVEYSKTLFKESKILGLFGESMGAATILQYSKISIGIDFIVAVCPFTNLEKLIRFHIQHLPRFLQTLVLLFVHKYIFIVGGFSIDEVNPGSDALETKIPILLAHGTTDTVTPFFMSEEFYKNRKEKAYTEFFVGENSGHTPDIYLDHKVEFEKILIGFLKRIKQISINL